MKAAIFGAGPIGLYFAYLCERANVDYEIFELSDSIGGQLTSIYPNKEITNIPGIPVILAKDYIKELASKIDSEKIRLRCADISEEELEGFDCKIDATGKGGFEPIALDIPSDDIDNVLYKVEDYSKFKGERIIVLGGGNSAIDIANALSKRNIVTIVHRRKEFRGDSSKLKARVYQMTPYSPTMILEGDIYLKNAEDGTVTHRRYDKIVVSFGLKKAESRIPKCDFSIGDSTKESSTIAEGMKQAEAAFAKMTEGKI